VASRHIGAAAPRRGTATRPPRRVSLGAGRRRAAAQARGAIPVQTHPSSLGGAEDPASTRRLTCAQQRSAQPRHASADPGQQPHPL